MHFTADLPSFYKSISKQNWAQFLGQYRINGINIPLGTTLSYSNLATMILVQRLFQVIQKTYAGKTLAGISPVGMELMFSEIYP